MRLTDAQMYRRLVAGDPTYNGSFFTGVLTTGIYCLPSCKAKKPKQENVRFFPTCEAARAAGFRPCLKCHPDDFARGSDPVLETMETVVSEVRSRPAHFPDAGTLVKRSGFGTTRAFELLRQHFHATPADLLVKARLDRAKVLLQDERKTLTDVAIEVGFESLSSFHDQFRKLNGITPGAYRNLSDGSSFQLQLPEQYPVNHLRRSLGRDANSNTDRITGNTYRTALWFGEEAGVLTLTLGETELQAEYPRGLGRAAHEKVVSLIGLEQPAESFAKLAEKTGLARLVSGRRLLRLPQTPSIFDALLWSVIGQQINLPFAFALRRRLVERAGTRVESDLIALPRPKDVAQLTAHEPQSFQFSRQKADYVLNLSRRVAEGQLELTKLAHQSATRVERVLMSERGLGPWSVNYVMMRALNFADCVPYGDTGVTSGLQTLFKLDERPDVDATRRLMAVFAPFRSLATAHLWQLNLPPP